MFNYTVKQKLISEFIGSMMLLIVIVGSGIMGEKLAGGNIAVALLANALATGAGLFVLINIFGPISGAHFNPIVSISSYFDKKLNRNELLGYISMQVAGAVLGVWLIHVIFDLSIIQFSTKDRHGIGLWVSEIFATFGLLLTIYSFTRHNANLTAGGVALYILGAYWFTASTSFANPAVTFARLYTNTFAGISPHDVFGFILAQIIGLVFFRFIWSLFHPTNEKTLAMNTYTDNENHNRAAINI